MPTPTKEDVVAPEAPASPNPPLSDEVRLREAEGVVRKNVLWSMGAGVLPAPVLDFIAIAGVQIKMLRELSHLYGVTFNENKVKNIVAALLGGLGANYLGRAIFFSVIKIIPGAGHAAAFFAIPAAAGGFTYAVGKTFILHFESGGTLLDFDAAKVKESFARKFQEGKAEARKLRTQPAAS